MLCLDYLDDLFKFKFGNRIYIDMLIIIRLKPLYVHYLRELGEGTDSPDNPLEDRSKSIDGGGASDSPIIVGNSNSHTVGIKTPESKIKPEQLEIFTTLVFALDSIVNKIQGKKNQDGIRQGGIAAAYECYRIASQSFTENEIHALCEYADGEICRFSRYTSEELTVLGSRQNVQKLVKELKTIFDDQIYNKINEIQSIVKADFPKIDSELQEKEKEEKRKQRCRKQTAEMCLSSATIDNFKILKGLIYEVYNISQNIGYPEFQEKEKKAFALSTDLNKKTGVHNICDLIQNPSRKFGVWINLEEAKRNIEQAESKK